MLGLSLAFLAGLIPALLWGYSTRVKVVALIAGIVLFWWGRYQIAWESPGSWQSLNSWWVALGLAVLGAASPKMAPTLWNNLLEGLKKVLGPLAKWAVILLIFGGLVYLLAQGHQSADPATHQLTLDTMFQMGLVAALIYALVYFTRNPPFKKKKKDGGH